MTARPRGRSPRPTRAAFTLLELMAVVLIIAILIAIAFPAYNSVMANARVTGVKTEIASIGNAIATFKAEFNSEPPSLIRFTDAANAAPANAAALAPETKAFLRKMFPQITFPAGPSPLQASLMQAGLWGEILTGNECLVFFLGGVRQHEDANGNGTLDAGEDLDGDGTLELTNTLVGFSKNPANPFAQPTPGQSNRLGPFYDFDTGRLVPAPDIAADPGSTPQLVYIDSLPGQSAPFAYASTAGTGNYVAAHLIGAGMTDVYRKGSTATSPAWNPKSYQIISPGFDGAFGDPPPYPPGNPGGGPYDPKSTSSLGLLELDNIANFSDGRLGG